VSTFANKETTYLLTYLL